MAIIYQLDTQAARRADSPGYIKKSGAYTGVITQAKAVLAKSGAEGVELSFKAVNGAEANYLTLWVQGANGDKYFGFDRVCALMTCLKIKSMSPQMAAVKKHDGTVEQAETYPDLLNKPVGLLLQLEEYAKKDGTVGESMNIVGCFNSETKQTSSEFLDGAPAEAIEAALLTLKDKKLKDQPKQQAAAQAPAPVVAAIDFNDDIPF
jgi:hypothetical protein